MRTKCIKCGTALHGKNAQDMGICLECYNIEQSADLDEEPDGPKRPVKIRAKEEKTLSEQDMRRIKEEAAKHFGWGTLSAVNFIIGAEYEHKYQREQQAELRLELEQKDKEYESLEKEYDELMDKINQRIEYLTEGIPDERFLGTELEFLNSLKK